MMWKVADNGDGRQWWTITDEHGEILAQAILRADAERICRAMTWELDATLKLTRLREAVEKHCRAFEESPIPGGSLIVGDLRAAFDALSSPEPGPAATTYDPETGCGTCGCPTLVDDRCWGCKRRVVEPGPAADSMPIADFIAIPCIQCQHPLSDHVLGSQGGKCEKQGCSCVAPRFDFPRTEDAARMARSIGDGSE